MEQSQVDLLLDRNLHWCLTGLRRYLHEHADGLLAEADGFFRRFKEDPTTQTSTLKIHAVICEWIGFCRWEGNVSVQPSA